MLLRFAPLAAIGVLAFAPIADAHVTVHPNQVPAGSYAVLSIRVPNEMSNADTTKIQVQMPDGFSTVSTELPSGWTASESTRKLATPITTEGGSIDTEVDEVTFSGGKIAPGQFLEFPISVALPAKPGATLTFKALQTYSNGDVVRWIGAAGADHPAPTIRLSAASGPLLDVAGSAPVTLGASAAPTSRIVGEQTGASEALAIAGLAAGVLGLVVGGLALVLVGRRR